VRRTIAALGDVYAATVRETGARVIVDSTKSPAYGRLLESVPGIELYVLHLVRDARATAWSWQKRAELDVPAPAFALIWSAWNPIIELLWSRRNGRYLRLRYEDFAAQPRDAVERIARFVGEEASSAPFVSPDEVQLEPTHSVAGNPGKGGMVGRATIRRDDEWRTAAGYAGRRTVAALTWPVRLRYGYREPAAPVR
jgi:hypothetical protein